jgi:4-aminobutyrate---pyruvate transaminase
MAACISGLPAMHKSFNLPDYNVVHTIRPHFYRDGLLGESEQDFVARLSRDVETLIEMEGPETISAFIAEPVMGAGGVVVPPQNYLPAVRAIVRK